MTIGWPEGIILALVFIGLGMHAARHGEARKDKYHFGSACVMVAVNLALFWWGGLFD